MALYTLALKSSCYDLSTVSFTVEEKSEALLTHLKRQMEQEKEHITCEFWVGRPCRLSVRSFECENKTSFDLFLHSQPSPFDQLLPVLSGSARSVRERRQGQPPCHQQAHQGRATRTLQARRH